MQTYIPCTGFPFWLLVQPETRSSPSTEHLKTNARTAYLGKHTLFRLLVHGSQSQAHVLRSLTQHADSILGSSKPKTHVLSKQHLGVSSFLLLFSVLCLVPSHAATLPPSLLALPCRLSNSSFLAMVLGLMEGPKADNNEHAEEEHNQIGEAYMRS